MKHYRKLILPLLLFIHFTNFAQADKTAGWKNCFTVEQVCKLYPDQIRHLFSKLDLAQPGFEQIQAAVKQEKYAVAGALLIEYYRKKARGHFYNVQDGVFDRKTVDDMLHDVFTITAHKAKVPRMKSGGLDWDWSPSDYSNNQWHQITRHRWLNDLMYANLKTGKKEYGSYLDQVLRDWCVNTNGVDLPTGSKLDPGCRMNEWPQVFYSFLSSDMFSDATILLMLNTFYKHGEWLANKQNWSMVNRLVTQMTGLMEICLGFPEFSDAHAWYHLANTSLQAELNEQIRPDGSQVELSHNYHQVVIDQYLEIKRLFQRSGRPFPQQMEDVIVKGIDYSANVLDPGGRGLMNNDSDEKSLRKWLLDKAKTYNRADWLYIATNGKNGVAPAGFPSKIFPWAGHFISRSNWTGNANWAFFDVGPWGMDHQHNDKLHISVYAYGRPLLVDAGRYTYKTDEWRAYFRGSQSHNVIMVNGQGQNGYEKKADSAFTRFDFKEDLDFCIGNYSAGWGDQKGKHTRALVYIKDKYWLVFDRVEVKDSGNITALWHFAPDCHVSRSGQDVRSDDPDKGNLLIHPISAQTWNITLKKGELDPIQGWYSKSSGYKTPEYCAEYATRIKDVQTFAWLLYPKKGTIENTTVSTEIIEQKADHMRIKIKDAVSEYEVTVDPGSGEVTIMKKC